MNNNIIFGIRPIIEAVKAGKEIDKVLIRKDLSGDLISELTTELRKNDIQIQYVPIERIDKISKGNNTQGVIAYISPVSYYEAEDILIEVKEDGKVPFFIILDSITDVRNFGAIARTAECLGVNAIIIPQHNSVRITEDAIKTSAGALFNIPVCRENNLTDCIMMLQQSGVKVVAATEKAAKSMTEINYNSPLAIVLGSEDLGISKSILKRADELVKIPMTGKTQSLNVSVSAGIFIYEVMRQRIFD